MVSGSLHQVPASKLQAPVMIFDVGETPNLKVNREGREQVSSSSASSFHQIPCYFLSSESISPWLCQKPILAASTQFHCGFGNINFSHILGTMNNIIAVLISRLFPLHTLLLAQASSTLSSDTVSYLLLPPFSVFSFADSSIFSLLFN